LGGIARENNMKPIMIGGVENHVHLLLGLPPVLAVSHAVKLIKDGSSIWVKEILAGLGGFGWQDGYAVFTVSKSLVPEVDAYIRAQREHHRVKTFAEEYRTFLAKHEIPVDERYLFDGEFAG
jgi:REP element-mobilizing transposase RayT